MAFTYGKIFLAVLLVSAGATNTNGQATSVDSPMDDSLLEIGDILPLNTKTYDKMRPPRSNGNATIVYFHVTVMSLDSIDESSMTYAADIFFAQSWKDPRLRFPKNMTGEYRLLPVSWLQEIWRPDSFFKNAKSVTFQTMTIPNHYVWLYQDSTILYMVKLTLLLSCAMTFQSYPHDTQQCAMKIESLSHTTADLIFIWDPDVPLVVDDSIELPQLDLVSNTTGDCTQVYSTGNFTCLEVSFTFKRRLGYYLFHTYIPTCLIVIMSWISFWIKPEAVPARVTLGVTSLLTLSTQHANSQKSLPPVSYIKAIDMFMSSCTVFVFLSLMEYAVVNVILGDMVEFRKQESLMKKISKKFAVKTNRRADDQTFNNIPNKESTAEPPRQTSQEPCDCGEDSDALESADTPPCRHRRRCLDSPCCERSQSCTNSGVGGLMGLSGTTQRTIAAHQLLNNRQSSLLGQTATIRHPPTSLNYTMHHQPRNQCSPPVPPSMLKDIAHKHQSRSSPESQHHHHQMDCHHHHHHHHHHRLRHQHSKHTSQTSLPPLSFYPNFGSNGNGSTPNLSRSFALEMRDARAKAILVDRFSRILFPFSFTILNILYWYVYFEW